MLIKEFKIIQALAAEILRRPHGYKWSLQGFGMLRLYLSDNIRLHVWTTEHRVENVSDIHDHPWDFISTVLFGQLKTNAIIHHL